MPEGVRVGVDIGGTFTDFVAVDDGTLITTKVPSTPDAPAAAVTDAVTATTDTTSFDPSDISFFAHGTTVATNAVLEADWADSGFLTTAGFRDVLEIGRQDRPDIYDFDAEKPPTPIPRDHRYDIPERVDERGTVLHDLDEDAVREAAATLEGVESIGVCFLFAYEHPAHEQRAAAILREELDVPVSVSSEVLPEIREYERSLTTALNTVLQPVVMSYLTQLEADLETIDVGAPLTIMGSNGGVMPAASARTRPVTTLLSGPAAGVKGAAHLAAAAGQADVVTMDMGGTSCDVSLVTDGEPTVTTDVEIGSYPVSIPMIDVHTVGSGGGSIAWIDAGDALRVGPQSAGADPGPVCYGRGGETPTTTDAQYVLGRIDPTNFLDDPPSKSEVREVIETEIAAPLGIEVEAAAHGIVDVANANMERALRVVSVERGHDPRGLPLVAYGGAGPLHASDLAIAMDMPEVLVPPSAGVLSALGLLVSDIAADESRSMIRRWEHLDPATLNGVYQDLEAAAADRLAEAAIPGASRSYQRLVDVRYVGQSFDLSISVPDELESNDLSGIAERFHDRHESRYGHADRSEPIELVTVRLRGRGHVETPPIDPEPRSMDLDDAIRTTRPVSFDSEVCDTRIYDRGQMPLRGEIDGPAVIEGEQSTALVQPSQTARIDDHGNLRIEVSA